MSDYLLSAIFSVIVYYIDEKRSDIEFLSSTQINRSQIIDQKTGDFSSYKLVINEFFTADQITKFMHSLHQKRAISEHEKLIKEENAGILWSNPSNVDISLLSFEYDNPFILLRNVNL